MKRRLAVILTTAGLVAASPAQACSVVFPKDYVGSAKQWRDVRESIEKSTAIVDGEVVRAWTPDRPALVRVEHVFKGYPSEFIEVGGPGAGADCSINLERTGERLRMILFGGPSPYNLFMLENPRMVDRILHSDRRKVWPYFPGTPTIAPQ